MDNGGLTTIWEGHTTLQYESVLFPPNHSTCPVPCYRRCSQMAVIPENEKIIKLDDDDDEGWVDTHHGVGK